MKTFTVIQSGNVFEVEATKIQYHSGLGLVMLQELRGKESLGNPGRTVFIGPSAFTTVIENDIVKTWPAGMEKPDA